MRLWIRAAKLRFIHMLTRLFSVTQRGTRQSAGVSEVSTMLLCIQESQQRLFGTWQGCQPLMHVPLNVHQSRLTRRTAEKAQDDMKDTLEGASSWRGLLLCSAPLFYTPQEGGGAKKVLLSKHIMWHLSKILVWSGDWLHNVLGTDANIK